MSETSIPESGRDQRGWRRWFWAANFSLLVAAAVWNLVAGAQSRTELPIGESLASAEGVEDPARSIHNLHGLTASDLGLLAASGRRTERRLVVAGFPGRRELAGPLLTRADSPKRILGDEAPPETMMASLGGGWRQIHLEGSTPEGRIPRLSTAEVSIIDRETGEQRQCPRIGLQKFTCDDPGWAGVEYRRPKIGGDRERCIWAHPLKGRTIAVDFGPIAPLKNGPYRLRTGLRDRIASGGGPVDVAVRFGSEEIDFQHKSEKGWRVRELPEIEEPTPLRIEVSADRVGQRHFCFRITGFR